MAASSDAGDAPGHGIGESAGTSTVLTEARARRAAGTILAPTRIILRAASDVGPGDVDADVDFEVSAHVCPRTLKEELRLVIPGTELEGVCAIVTAQKTETDLAAWGEEAAREKDACLERFVRWAGAVSDWLRDRGSWADIIDPCSGHPLRSGTRGAVYSEVDGVQALLGYRVVSAGGCRIVLHPKWGSRFYPATFFTTAPPPLVLEAIRACSRDPA